MGRQFPMCLYVEGAGEQPGLMSQPLVRQHLVADAVNHTEEGTDVA